MIRFAIFAAVSTEGQAAEDKASIPAQISTCQRVIAQYGIEVAQYTLDGYSRTGYDSLQDAMNDIPPLKHAIEDAAANRYDILIVDNFDRFGDLAYMMGTRFKKLRKQIYSARQSGRVVPPEEYDPYADDSMSIHMHVGGIIQNYRINKIRRGYNIGIPNRLDKGLHALQVPFGYKHGMRDQPAAQIPEQIKLVRQMKDWLFEGCTLGEITRRANDSGVPTQRGKQWDITAVHRVLDNPYYAGLVVHGKTSAKRRLPRSRWVIKPGIHTPVWDEATYHAILAELDRRQQGKNKKSVYSLSGVLICAMCGSRMYRSGSGKNERIYLSCGVHFQKHPMIEYKNALALVAGYLPEAIRNEARTSSKKISAEFDRDLAELSAQREVIQRGYEARLYTLPEAQKKIIAIENRMDEIKRKQLDLKKNESSRKVLLDLAKQSPEAIENWLLTADAVTVNRALHAMLEGIIINREQQIEKVLFR